MVCGDGKIGLEVCFHELVVAKVGVGLVLEFSIWTCNFNFVAYNSNTNHNCNLTFLGNKKVLLLRCDIFNNMKNWTSLSY